MRVSQEEIFGPVAAVVRFEDDDDAIRIANGTVYSLAAGVWTADVTRAHRFTRALKAGTVWVNTYGPTDIRLPWGGARDSGSARTRRHGHRQFHGAEGGLDQHGPLNGGGKLAFRADEPAGAGEKCV